jgi:hypothetical protein
VALTVAGERGVEEEEGQSQERWGGDHGRCHGSSPLLCWSLVFSELALDLGSGDGWQRWLLFGETGRGWGEFFKLKFGNGIFSLFFFINNFLYLFILFKIFYLNI